jgi:hypothetical protein
LYAIVPSNSAARRPEQLDQHRHAGMPGEHLALDLRVDLKRQPLPAIGLSSPTPGG